MIAARPRSATLRAVALALLVPVLVAGPAFAGIQKPGVVEARPYRLPLTTSSVLTPEIAAAVDVATASGALGARTALGSVVSDPTRVRNGVQPWFSGGTLNWKGRCGRYDDSLLALDRKRTLGGWCWPAGEQESGPVALADWVPQGVTSTAESSQLGTYEGRRLTAVSWYAGARGQASNLGSRVTFMPTPATRASVGFTHVVLAEPYVGADGLLGLAPVRVHAGGIAWSGPYLFVPQTKSGLRVFDTRRVYRVGNGPNLGADPVTDVLQGGGARYAMLEVARYTQPVVTGCRTRAFFPICFSTVSVDRSTSPARLVVAEYLTRVDMVRLDRGAPIAYWDLAPDGLLRTDAAGVALSRPIRASYTYSTQGAVVNAATKDFYFAAGDVGRGWFVFQRNGDGRRALLNRTWPAGAEAITQDRRGGRIWSLTEIPGRRTLFWVHGCEMRGAKPGCAR